MNRKALILAAFLWCVSAAPAVPNDASISAKGIVVAIQRGENDARVIESFGDLAEIYMVRVDQWSRPRKEKYIIVEYVHHTGLIPYDRFDKAVWVFALSPKSLESDKDCHSWIAVDQSSFMPTALGARKPLPNPSELTCYLTRVPPVEVSTMMR